MNGIITKLRKLPSKKGGHCCLIEVLGEDGLKYESWPDDSSGMLEHWEPIIKNGIGKKLYGLKPTYSTEKTRYFSYKNLPHTVEEPVKEKPPNTLF